MKFLLSLVWPLRIWQSLASAPFGVSKKLFLPTKNTKLYYYAIISLFVHIILLVLVGTFPPIYIDWSSSNIVRFDNLFAMTLVHISSCVILGEAIFKVNKQMDFLKQIIRIDFVMYRKLGIRFDYKKYQFGNNLITAIWIIGLLFCVISIAIAMHAVADTNDQRFWAFYIGPLIIYSLNYHRMVLYVFVIHRRYKLLNQFIEKICILQENDASHQNILQTFEQSTKRKGSPTNPMAVQLISESQLKDIRNCYQMLYEATKMINELFLWSLPLCIGIDFHRLLVNVFFIFSVWLLQSYGLFLIVAMSWGSLNIAHFIILSHACHTTSKEVEPIDIKLIEILDVMKGFQP